MSDRSPFVRSLCLCILFAVLSLLAAGTLVAQPRFEETPLWPLCGDLYKEAAYAGYDADQWMLEEPTCPQSRQGSAFTDELQAPYGPRHLKSALEYDWHRGIDIPTKTPSQTALEGRRPVFAIAAGRVIVCEKKNPGSGPDLIPCDDPASVDPDFPDIRLVVEHERPGYDPTKRCHPGGCYYARYTHLSQVRAIYSSVNSNASGIAVVEGEFLGLTGHPDGSTFNHLHFEIRSSTLEETDISQREAINPLAVLPYADSAAGACADDPATTCDSSLTVAFATPSNGGTNPLGSQAVDLTDPHAPIITVEAQLPAASDELDLDRVALELYKSQPASGGGYELVPVPQPNTTFLTMTPENETWVYHPQFFDIQLFNRQYTYKHEGSSAIDYGYGNQDPVPFADFEAGGAHASPFSSTPAFLAECPSNRSDCHLTATVAGSDSIGEFNGLRIWPARFNSKNSQQVLYVQFRELDGTGATDDLCVKANAYDLRGQRSASPALWGPCAPPAPATVVLDHTYAGSQILISPVAEAGFYRLWQYADPAGTADPAREKLVRESPDDRLLLGRIPGGVSYAVEACYASAPSCITSSICPETQCSDLIKAE